MKASPLPVRITTRLWWSSPIAWNRWTNCPWVWPLKTSLPPSVCRATSSTPLGLRLRWGVRERLSIGVKIRHWGLPSQKLFHRDRQVTHSLARRVIHGIGDRRRHRHGGELPEALGSERARFLVELANEERLELRDIRIRRDEVAGIVAVEEAAQGRIGLRLLKQRLPDAPDDPADGLTASRLGIDDAAGVVRADEAVQAHQAKIGVDAYFGEHGGEAE